MENKKQIDLNLLAKSEPRQTIREHTDELLECAEKLGQIYNLDEEILKMLKIACEYHDYGKINEQFQIRIQQKEKRFDEKLEIPHSILSSYFLEKKDFNVIKDYYSVFYAVLNHHYLRDSFENMMNNQVKKELIESIVKQYIDKEIIKRDIENLKAVALDKTTILIKGLLHRCDYAASAGTNVEYENDFLIECMQNMINRWRIEKGMELKWNNLQEFCIQHRDSNVIVTAPTGMGKTEAALLWIGNNKGIYILPLRSAINGIFDRVKKEVLKGLNIDTKLALMHSDNIGYLSRIGESAKMDLFEYRTRTRQYSLPISISTPDQLFDFVFRAAGYEMKLATAAYSKIVIDEIQAYDATMLAYLIFGIHQIINMGGKVAILTATLPGFVKKHLENGEKKMGDIEAGKKYSFDFSDFSNDNVRHNLKVFKTEIDVKYIKEKWQENIENRKSNKILVICNTVRKAQEMYEQLKNAKLEKMEINLLHAKYIKMDRTNKEKNIIEDGKTEICKNVIWVTTQVVEASLDIDFDYLFTELSDLNGLFQRLGRCNRKGLKPVDEPNCFVFTEICPEILSKKDNDKGFIDQRLYELSKNALESLEGKISEKKKNQVIVDTFSCEAMAGSLYERNYRETYQSLMEMHPNDFEIEKVKKKFRNIISYSIIPESVYDKYKDEIEHAESTIKKSGVGLNQELKKKLWDEKQKALNMIMDCTLDVGYFDLYGHKKKISKVIDLGINRQIPVLKCNYKDMGFIRLNKEQLEKLDISPYEEDYGVFM